MYYDVAAREYWCPENGIWISSLALPPRYRDLDLDHSYVVMLNKHASKPWLDHTYYSQNYPAHAHERYGEIVEQNHLITNIPPEHVVTPRAYNENNDRVTFVEHPRVQVPQPPAPRPVEPRRSVAQNPVVHEVPMRTISPAMPTESRRYNYGSGYHGR